MTGGALRSLPTHLLPTRSSSPSGRSPSPRPQLRQAAIRQAVGRAAQRHCDPTRSIVFRQPQIGHGTPLLRWKQKRGRPTSALARAGRALALSLGYNGSGNDQGVAARVSARIPSPQPAPRGCHPWECLRGTIVARARPMGARGEHHSRSHVIAFRPRGSGLPATLSPITNTTGIPSKRRTAQAQRVVRASRLLWQPGRLHHMFLDGYAIPLRHIRPARRRPQ